MNFELPALPYEMDALEPHISRKTIEFHYGRHHRGYLEKLRGLVEGTPDADRDLADLVKHASGAIFNNAAQVWNHTFYWNSLTPDGGGEPAGPIATAIDRSFGSYGAFRKEFSERAVGLFGSGYLWLSADPVDGRLLLEPLKDADNPMRHVRVPILALDVWEHAYYLDHQNQRNRYVDAFLTDLVNWRHAESALEAAA